MKQKTIGIWLIFIGVILLLSLLITSIMAWYNFNKNYLSYWELADRSSTLLAKEQYISQFTDLLLKNRNKFADYNAIFLKTPQNNFDNNLNALTTLKDRLNKIQSIDEKSFEYQTAVQQITAQEQGEAQKMIYDIKGSFYLKNYIIVWNWIGIFSVSLTLILILTGTAFLTLGLSKPHTSEY